MTRPSKFQMYMNIAEDVSERSTCLRRHFGAVLIKDGIIVSTGYNGAPRGSEHCSVCNRDKLKVAPGTRYEECKAVHAEVNAIINAARAGVSTIDTTMYIYGFDVSTDKSIIGNPCKLCAPIIINSGVVQVIGEDVHGVPVEWDKVTTY